MNIYGYLKMDIAKVENVKEMMHHKIDDYYELLIDDETEQADIKSLFIDFALSMRTQINLLSLAIDDLNKTNTNLILNVAIIHSSISNNLYSCFILKYLSVEISAKGFFVFSQIPLSKPIKFLFSK